MGVTGGVNPTRLVMRGRSLEDECERDPLECLVGEWTATGFTTSILEVRSGGDGLALTVARDQSFTLDYSPMTEITASIPNVSDIVLRFRITGEATGIWIIVGDQIAAADLDARALQSSGSAEVAGMQAFAISGSVEDLIRSAGGIPTQTDWFALDCSATAMRFSNPLGEWAFTRD